MHIKKSWEEFIEKYKKYLLNEEKCLNNLKLIEDYTIKNNKRPSNNDKNKDIKQLGK